MGPISQTAASNVGQDGILRRTGSPPDFMPGERRFNRGALRAPQLNKLPHSLLRKRG